MFTALDGNLLKIVSQNQVKCRRSEDPGCLGPASAMVDVIAHVVAFNLYPDFSSGTKSYHAQTTFGVI